MKNEKIITSIIVFAFASVFLILSFGFPESKATDVGPGFLPQIYSSALYILCIILFIQGVREEKGATPTIKNALLVFLAMIISLIYVFLVPYAGFYIITPIAMAVLLLMSRVRSVLTIILIPAITTMFIFVFFEKMLKVPVPTGIFFS